MRAAPRADNAPPFRPDAPRRSAAVPWLPVLLVLVGHGLEASARVSGAEPDGAAPAGAAAAATEPDEMDVPTRVRIDQLVKSARLAAEAGKAAEALAELRSANTLVKQARGANHPDTLPILDMAADILVGNGQFAEASLPLQRAIALRETLLADGRRVSRADLAASQALLARVTMSQGAFDRAAELLAKALDHFEAVLDRDHDANLAARRALADAQTGLGDHAAAEATLRELLARQRGRFGAGHPDCLATATALARAIWCASRHDAAREFLATAIAEFERAGGPRESLPEPLVVGGEFDLAAGDAAAARGAWRRAWEIDRGTKGPDHAVTACDRLRLLWLDTLDGGEVKARDAADDIVRHLGDLAARDDPAAAAGLRAAAALRLAFEGHGRAVGLFDDALEADRRLLGVDHPDTAADEAGLGRCLLDGGDAASGRKFLDHARATAARTRGPGHPDTLSITAALGACAAAAGDRATAEASLKTLLGHEVPRLDDRTEADLCRLADGLAALEEAAGDRDTAAQTRLSVVALRRRQFGETHPYAVADIVALADARQEAGAGDDAAALYERAVQLAEQGRGRDHPDVAAILTPLARSYRGLGADDLAEKALARGMRIWQESLGGDHPVTLATTKMLALVRLALRDDAGALPLMERLLTAYDADPRSDQADVARLLRRLSQVHDVRGDKDKARVALARAMEIEVALGSAPAAGEPAADVARLQKMLAFDEDAASGLARARGIAANLDAARERITRGDRVGPTRSSADSIAAAMPDGSQDDVAAGGNSAADVAASLPDAGAVIAAAWVSFRAGRAEEAVALVRQAARKMDAALRLLGAPQRSDLAALLAAQADLRPQVLAWDEASRLYERAALLDAEALGDGHPLALCRALALADARRARGDAKIADDILALIAARAPQAASSATPPQAERLGAALEASARVALAAGNRAAAIRLLDLLVDGWGDDERLVVFALDALALAPDAVLVDGGKDPAGAELLARAVRGATRIGAADPAVAGLALHAAAIEADLAGDAGEAERLLGRALETDRRVLGQAHPRVALHLLVLAGLATRRADKAAADDMLAEAHGIEARADRAGAGAADLRRLAARHLARREFTDAAQVLAAALAAETKGRGGDPRVIAAIAADSGLVSAARGSAERAEELLSEAVSIAQGALGSGHGDTVSHAVRRERLTRSRTQPAVAATGAGPQADADAGPGDGTSLAAVLAGNRRPAAGGRDATPRRGGADRAAMAADRTAADRPATGRSDDDAGMEPAAAAPDRGARGAEADKARRALDAATRLYGGDPKKRKKSGSGRQGLESIIAYTSAIEAMAESPDRAPLPAAGTPAGRGDPAATVVPDRSAPDRSAGDRQPVPRSAAAPRAAPPVDVARAAPRRAPFVAASKSGLRQRTALARTRAVGVEPKTITVEQLMRAAWSSHMSGSGADAAAACEQAVALAARESGAASPQLEETLDQAAAIAVAQGDYARGKAWLERLGSLRWKLHGPADPRVADVAVRLAGLLAECGEFDKARPLCERALAGRTAGPDADRRGLAQVVLVQARVDLGQGNPAAALAGARRASAILAEAWDRGDRPPTADGPLLRLRLATVRLLAELGAAEAARDEIDRICIALEGGRPLSPRLVESILAEAARTRRLCGDASGAVGVATQAVEMVQRQYKPCVATAEQLVELALARRAAGDPAWEDPAREAARILVPAARRMTSANCEPAAIEALRGITAAWLESGRVDRAFDACTALQLAAAALPPTHPTAVRVMRLASRVAWAKGDAARAEALVKVDAATGRAARPLEVARQQAFFEAAADPQTRDAVSRRRPAGVNGSGSAPASPPPGRQTPPNAAAAPRATATSPAVSLPARP